MLTFIIVHGLQCYLFSMLLMNFVTNLFTCEVNTCIKINPVKPKLPGKRMYCNSFCFNLRMNKAN
jgi:hypothetical protein